MSSKPVTWVLAPSLTAKTTAPRFAACANAPCGRAVSAQRRGTASRRSEARSRCGRGVIATPPRQTARRGRLVRLDVVVLHDLAPALHLLSEPLLQPLGRA